MKMDAERITVEELREKLESGQEVQLLDVRNRTDYMKSGEAIPGSIRMPVNRVLERLGELNPVVETIAYCT